MSDTPQIQLSQNETAPSELADFINWFGWVGISTFYKDGHEYIEFENFTDKSKAGIIRCTIDGEEVFDLTRKSQCCSFSTYSIPTDREDEIRCTNCGKKCSSYLDKLQ